MKVEGSGSCRSRPWGKQRWVEGSMWDRVEGEGPRMDCGGRNDVDGMAGEKGGRVTRDD